MKHIAILFVLVFTLTGCSRFGAHFAAAEFKHSKNEAAIQEESKALTTGVVDTLQKAPPSEATDLALQLAQHDQALEGLPRERLPVQAILNGDEKALALLQSRYDLILKLIRDKAELAAKLEERESKLIALGIEAEKEKNRTIVKRFWFWGIGSFGTLGFIALCIFCPALVLPLVPMVFKLIGFVVNKIPALAHTVGVVGVGAWNATVKGVGNVRDRFKIESELPIEKQPVYTPDQVRKVIDGYLRDATEVGDANYKPLINATRAKVNV